MNTINMWISARGSRRAVKMMGCLPLIQKWAIAAIKEFHLAWIRLSSKLELSRNNNHHLSLETSKRRILWANNRETSSTERKALALLVEIVMVVMKIRCLPLIKSLRGDRAKSIEKAREGTVFLDSLQRRRPLVRLKSPHLSQNLHILQRAREGRVLWK